MKLSRWIGLGLSLWAASLVWPEINGLLSFPITIGLIGVSLLGLLALVFLSLLEQYDDQPGDRGQDSSTSRSSEAEAKPNHAQPTQPTLGAALCNSASRPTRPIAI